MSPLLPETVDAWRMVAAGRSFHGSLPLARMTRLAPSLAGTDGSAAYDLQFARDALGCAQLAVHVEAPLQLICQRSLAPFTLPVVVDARLGLIEHERDEAALPPDCEPLLLDAGMLNPASVIEDELLLALPLVPVNPDSEPVEIVDAEAAAAASGHKANPFAVLGELKQKRQ
jgi:uncharacterized protein